MSEEQGNLFGIGAYGGYRYDDGPTINERKSREVTNDAVERASHLVSDERKAEMYEAIVQAAKSVVLIHSDDIWEILGAPKGRWDGCALGPVFREAARCGVVRDTGTFQRSKRPETHRRPGPVWESLIVARNVNQ